MGKTVRRLAFSDIWRIGEHESWLTDMAAKGLHFKKSGKLFAHFEKGQPMDMRYRLEFTDKGDEISPEQIQMYGENGWEYVSSYNRFHIFRSPADSGAPEIHTDPSEQSFTLKSLSKHLVKSAVVVGLLVMWNIFAMVKVFIEDSTPLLSFVDGSTINLYIGMLFMTYIAFQAFKSAVAIKILRKSLFQGKMINHRANWRPHRTMSNIIWSITLCAALFLVIHPFALINSSKTTTLPVSSNNLPIVRLGEVENNPDLQRKSEYVARGVDWGNWYRYQWSILAPVQYETYESGIVPDKMWPDGSGDYKPNLASKIYRLRFGFMAEKVVKDLVEKNGLSWRGAEYLQHNHEAFDLLLVHEEDTMKDIFGYKGRNVIYIRYNGIASLEDMIEAAKKIVFLEK